MEEIPIEEPSSNQLLNSYRKLQNTYQKFLDQSTPHVKHRWTAFGFLFVIFFARILLSQGWYIVCYGLGIYLLNLFLSFLQPKFDPSVQREIDDENLESGQAGEEFKPFIRRLSEFKFWYRATLATSISIILTLFSFTDIPVFWPILLIYFITLFLLTMRRQIQHMIKYRYIPLDIGKKKYGSK